MDELTDNQVLARLRAHYRRGQHFAEAVRACGWPYKPAYDLVIRTGAAREFGLGRRRPRRDKAGVPASPDARVLQSRIGGYERAARVDTTRAAAKMRAAQPTKRELRVDPDLVLDPKERKRRAECLRKADALRGVLASAKARRLRKAQNAGRAAQSSDPAL